MVNHSTGWNLCRKSTARSALEIAGKMVCLLALEEFEPVPARNSIDYKKPLIHRGCQCVEGAAERARAPDLMAARIWGKSGY